MGNAKQEITVTFWGVRGSTPCANKKNMEYGGNTSCVEIDVPGTEEMLILDSGTGIRNLGNKIIDEPGQIRGRIFITHPHWDHIQGFPFFKPIYGSTNHFAIHMPDQGEEGDCKDILDGHLTKTFFPVTLDMIDANLEYVTQPQQRTDYQHYEIEFILANHTVETAVYKIHVGDKQIVYCPDNELGALDEEISTFQTRMKEFVQGADLLIHDGQYNRKTYESKRGWGHSAWEHVVNFAKVTEVKRLFITHHDPDSDDEKLLALDEYLRVEYGELFKEVGLAQEGKKILL
ncbi:MBL fold metallo-hydrolase [Fodinibius sp.]|uniref:MBL fold metallo-hydrolase n=1 Tax=Fodinibius sp. TaxID=1872440 RepID=UPI002ACEAACE|nr:MBL fold metallo-hydrolase [Fodinibius sp.]MDZ7660002.1 MBL fold metallo-hydrolase [Fodinibius sp.]